MQNNSNPCSKSSTEARCGSECIRKVREPLRTEDGLLGRNRSAIRGLTATTHRSICRAPRVRRVRSRGVFPCASFHNYGSKVVTGSADAALFICRGKKNQYIGRCGQSQTEIVQGHAKVCEVPSGAAEWRRKQPGCRRRKGHLPFSVDYRAVW